MYGNLYVKQRRGERLAEFANECGTLLGLPTPHQRLSSNYVDEEYYVCSALGLEFHIARSDDSEFVDYAFWFNWRPEVDSGGCPAFLDDLADVVAQKLRSLGYSAARESEAAGVIRYDP